MSSMRGATDRFAEGERLLRAGEYDAAVAEFSAAITLWPDYRLAYQRQAEAYQNLEMEEEARADLEAAESILLAKGQQGETVTCSNCGRESPTGTRYCARCGASLVAARSQPGWQPGYFGKAFAWTAIPIVALSIISTAGAGNESFYFAWLAAAGLWGLALLGAIIIAIAPGPGERASGIWAGIGVGLLALAAT